MSTAALPVHWGVFVVRVLRLNLDGPKMMLVAEGGRKVPVGPPLVKGTAILGIASSVLELLGPDIYERTVAYLPEPVGSAFRYGTITPGAWVPLAWHVSLHAAVLSVTRSGPNLFRRVAKHTTLTQLRGVYKVFARIVGPEAVFPRATSIMQTYYSHANIDVREVRPGYCTTEFNGCTGFTPAIWENICGACEAVLEVSGAKSVRVRMAPTEPVVEDAMVIKAHWA